MSEHLPECPWDDHADMTTTNRCICPALRACEQRSYALGIEVGKHDGWIAGHTAGVQAARDAVLPHLAVLTRHACTASNWEQTDALMRRVVTDALAAIDALRGES